MEVVEEVCENCFGILSFRDRIQVEVFALCFLWAPFSALSLILVKCFLASALSVFSKWIGKACSAPLARDAFLLSSSAAG